MSAETIIAIGSLIVSLIIATPGILAYRHQAKKADLDLVAQYDKLTTEQFHRIEDQKAKITEIQDRHTQEIAALQEEHKRSITELSERMQCYDDALAERDKEIAELYTIIEDLFTGIFVLVEQLKRDGKTPLWEPSAKHKPVKKPHGKL